MKHRYNEGKPITSSRDTQEIHPVVGMEALKLFKEYPFESSILDDFQFYEKKQNNFSGGLQSIPQPKQKQQEYYNNISNFNNMNMSNLNNQNFQQMNQFNTNTQNITNEDFYQKMNMKDLGNNANNFNNERMNFPDKNQNIMKKDIKDKNFQQGNYINN